ncbi:MAG: hypothetical protein VX834_05840 [Myxococcota bacterium]|nr:hypothetical protein [Myxococcota bacterium]
MMSLNRTLAFLIVTGLLSGCAGREFIVRGDELVKQGRYTEAIVFYEKARELAPDSAGANDGIKQARRMAVTVELDKAQVRLKEIDYAGALAHALRASKMPLDLDEVDLKGRIRDAISQAEKRAEDRVQDWVNRGHFIPAVELADLIVDASRGLSSRKRWADGIRTQASEFFSKRADGENVQAHHGSRALQKASAQSVGADYSNDEIREHWTQFVAPVCFSKPALSVTDPTGNLGDIQAAMVASVDKRLAVLQKRCGQGQRPLKVRVEFTDVARTDEVNKTRSAKPFPGVRVETEEVYYEEVPYIVTEEVTVYETRIKKVEKRDCAPRPGKPRGCVTWVEDVEEQVPVKVKKEVEKVKKVERRRPITDLSEDKVLYYDVTTTERAVKLYGAVVVEGSEGPAMPFRVLKEAKDASNEKVESARMTIEADPLEIDSMPSLEKEAIGELSRAVVRAVGRAVRTWMAQVRNDAQVAAAAGDLEKAEDLFLQLVALAVPPNDQMNRFFKQRYGQAVGDALQPLSVALGRELGIDRDARKKRKRKLPTRRMGVDDPKKAKKKVVKKPAPEIDKIAAPAGEVEEAPAVTEDLHEFEHSDVDDAFDAALGGEEEEEEEEEDKSKADASEAKKPDAAKDVPEADAADAKAPESE